MLAATAESLISISGLQPILGKVIVDRFQGNTLRVYNCKSAARALQ